MERVAATVFAVAAAAGLATVGLGPVASLGLVLLGSGLLGYAACQALGAPSACARAADRAIRLGGVLAFLLPLVFWLGAALGDHLTRVPWQDALTQLDQVAGEANMLLGAGEAQAIAETGPPEAPPGTAFRRFWEGMWEGTEVARDTLEAVTRYREAADVFFEEADTLLSASLTIIAVYILRILVLPGLILWGALAMARSAMHAR